MNRTFELFTVCTLPYLNRTFKLFTVCTPPLGTFELFVLLRSESLPRLSTPCLHRLFLDKYILDILTNTFSILTNTFTPALEKSPPIVCTVSPSSIFSQGHECQRRVRYWGEMPGSNSYLEFVTKTFQNKKTKTNKQTKQTKHFKNKPGRNSYSEFVTKTSWLLIYHLHLRAKICENPVCHKKIVFHDIV